jgi:hypothetical protein
MLLPVLLLSLAPQRTVLPEAPVATQASVLIEEGRAWLVSRSQSGASLRQGQRAFAPAEGGHLEIRAGSRAVVRWPGRASLSIEGPAAVEWRAGQDPERAEAATRALPGGGLDIHLHDLRRAAFEGRRGEHRLFLGRDWVVPVDGQALRVEQCSTEAVRVEHQAGAPLALRWGTTTGWARPDLRLRAGQSVALGAGPPTRVDRTAETERWDRGAWPWRTERETDLASTSGPFLRPRVEESGEDGSGRRSSGATEPGPGEAVSQAPDEGITARAGADAPRVEGATGATSTKRVESAPRAAVPAAPAVVSHELRVEQAGGLAAPLPEPEGGYETLGTFAVERSPFVELRRYPNGRARVLVSGEAPRAMRCMANGRACRLEPGGVLVLEPDGAIGAIYGVLLQAP